jgi:ribosomal protein S18 acetylase RimI-like enzyme
MSELLMQLPGLTIAPQSFEAGIFGAPVWRLTLAADTVTKEVGAVVGAARREGVALIACRLADGDARGRDLLKAGFRWIERLVTFERPLRFHPRVQAQLAKEADAEACAAIGASVFTYDRYHADQMVPGQIADEIRRQWVLEGICGRSDAAIVAREDSVIAGFNLCMKYGDVAVIDLIGVARAYQKKGVGRKLVRSALDHYAGVCKIMRVGTQEANLASLALYNSEGFTFASAAETYHWTP